jgi:drug/metabolite transporter (DMT)-like permease
MTGSEFIDITNLVLPIAATTIALIGLVGTCVTRWCWKPKSAREILLRAKVAGGWLVLGGIAVCVNIVNVAISYSTLSVMKTAMLVGLSFSAVAVLITWVLQSTRPSPLD